MTDKPDDPAFPFTYTDEQMGPMTHPGMSLRQYAAIKLRVADSGLPWLDEMIEKSRRNDLAEKIGAIYMQDVAPGYEGEAAGYVIRMADAMLKARGK